MSYSILSTCIYTNRVKMEKPENQREREFCYRSLSLCQVVVQKIGHRITFEKVEDTMQT